MSRRLLAAIGTVVATAACTDSTLVIEPDATVITIVDNAFVSNHVQVFADQQVVWTWAGQNQHNVTFDVAGVDPSPSQSAGQIARRFTAFASGDQLTYYCSIHGRSVMSGIIAIR